MNMLDYIEKEKEALSENVKTLREKINANKIDKKLAEKINRFSLKFELSEQLIKNKIKNDDLFILCFVKEPNRQSFHQRLAADYIKNNVVNIIDFKVLPSGGKNALYVISGILQNGKTVAVKNKPKSIDFYWKYNTRQYGLLEFYATHKYTKEGGGAQDNQFNDVRNFLENAQNYNGNDKFFIAICDGDYYHTIKYKQNNITYDNKVTYLKTNYCGGNRKIEVLGINDLNNFLLSL